MINAPTMSLIDETQFPSKNSYMNTAVLSEAQRELEAAIAQASLPMHQRDQEAVRKACERMDRMREELRSRIGTVDLAVELIREARNP